MCMLFRSERDRTSLASSVVIVIERVDASVFRPAELNEGITASSDERNHVPQHPNEGSKHKIKTQTTDEDECNSRKNFLGNYSNILFGLRASRQWS